MNLEPNPNQPFNPGVTPPPALGTPTFAPPMGELQVQVPQNVQPQVQQEFVPDPPITPVHQTPQAVQPTTVINTAVAPSTGSTLISNEDQERIQYLLNTVNTGYSQRMVGQEKLKRNLLITLLAGGHILLESVPGLAKTTAAHSLASTVEASFKRIQCTPDLMPSDIIGTQIWNQKTNEFDTKLGPVHANFVLLDEINRSSAKTQSAMLEAMQERQTSIGGIEYKLPNPFFVIATQNPIEQEGTYHLPEAQLDRFLIKDVLDYPTPYDEYEILNRLENGVFNNYDETYSITLEDLQFLQDAVSKVYIDQSIRQYIINIVYATRHPKEHNYFTQEQAEVIEYGASPRATIAFFQAAKANALLEGRTNVIPDDVKNLGHQILRHRIVLSYHADVNGIKVEDVIDTLLSTIPVP